MSSDPERQLTQKELEKELGLKLGAKVEIVVAKNGDWWTKEAGVWILR